MAQEIGLRQDLVRISMFDPFGRVADRFVGIEPQMVADIEEGVALRDAGIDLPILVFGALSVSDLDGLFSHDLTPTLSTPAAAAAVEAAATRHRRRLRCHLKVDTGMHRLGFRHDNLERTIPSILQSPT